MVTMNDLRSILYRDWAKKHLPFVVHKHSPREYSFPLSPDSQKQHDESVDWIVKIPRYLEKRDLIPDRVCVIIDNDSEYKRWYRITFNNTKDAFMFDIAFAEVIQQEYDQYG